MPYGGFCGTLSGRGVPWEEANRQRPGPGKYQTCEARGAMLV